jgi:hypothetical protein
MDMKLFGMSCRLEIIVICLIVGAILGGHLLCSCSRVGLIEGMKMMGSALDSDSGNDQTNGWQSKSNQYAQQMGYSDTRTRYSQNTGTPVPLPEGQLFMFSDNKFTPECCPSTYTSSTGCACITQEQVNFINQRGGNRSIAPAEF